MFHSRRCPRSPTFETHCKVRENREGHHKSLIDSGDCVIVTPKRLSSPGLCRYGPKFVYSLSTESVAIPIFMIHITSLLTTEKSRPSRQYSGGCHDVNNYRLRFFHSRVVGLFTSCT
jgi:hypothetical protein